MREASCTPLAFILGQIEKRGLELAQATRDVPYPLAHLCNRNERVEWSAFHRVWSNIGELLNDQEIINYGRKLLRSPLALPFAVMARLLFDVRQVYLWIVTPKRGFGKQTISCMTGRAREVSDTTLIVETRMDEGYAPSREFFLFNQGAFIELSSLFGAGPAEVTMREVPGGVDYEIRHGTGGGWLGKIWRALSWPFTARRAARALQETHLALQERYTDLEKARSTLEEQATQLQLAHEIGQLVSQNLELDAMMDAVTGALVTRGRFRYSHIVLSRDSEGNTLHYDRTAGELNESDVPLSLAIEARGQRVGTLELRAEKAHEATCRALLGQISPTIQMAVQNALAFRTVVDYRDNLAGKVAQRTHELETARDELAHALGQLKASQEARQRFFANVNHEIRTPLSLILLIVSEIEEHLGQQSNEEALSLRERLSRIRSHTDALLALVNDLLLLSAGQEGKLQIQPKNCDLRNLIKKVVADWLKPAQANGVALTTDLVETTATVDPRGFARLLSNLLSNAIKFTPNGGTVTVQTTREPDGFCLVVSDTGRGIEPSRLGTVFDRFESAGAPIHRLRGSAGIGIGLPIVKELIEAHGGRIELRSAPGEGTTFSLHFPTVQCDEDWDEEPPTLFGPATIPTPLVHRGLNTALQDRPAATVLVAEDEPELREAIVRIVSREFHVVSAQDGVEALALAKQVQPDVLVTDLGMPGMRGEELTRQFRQLVGNRLAPVIILSAFAGMETRVTGFEAGAVDYIVKPFVPEDLLARIRAQLSFRHLALQLHEAEKVVSIGILTTGLAHELRNPANAIVNAIGPLQSLLSEQTLQDRTAVDSLLRAIKVSADNMLILCRDLLGFTERGDALMRNESVSELVSAALKSARQAVQEARVHVRLSYEGSVSCARALVVHALTNLIDNAVEATGPGGRLEIRSQLENNSVVISVLDDGPGIEPALREKIFEPFFTTKPPGQGTGLGLTLCRTVAHQHGGSLKLVRAGALNGFEMSLPLSASETT